MIGISYNKAHNHNVISGFYTAKDVHATAASRSARNIVLAEGMCLVRDLYDHDSGIRSELTDGSNAAPVANTSELRRQGTGMDWYVFDKDDAAAAINLYSPVCVVKSPGPLADGSSYARGFDAYASGEVQALISDAGDLAEGALLYLTDGTGYLSSAPMTAVSSVIDTVAELYGVATRPVAILLESQDSNSTNPVLRWVRLLNLVGPVC